MSCHCTEANGSLPALDSEQQLKLKQLTAVTIAQSNKVCCPSRQAVQVSALAKKFNESFLCNLMYVGLQGTRCHTWGSRCHLLVFPWCASCQRITNGPPGVDPDSWLRSSKKIQQDTHKRRVLHIVYISVYQLVCIVECQDADSCWQQLAMFHPPIILALSG